MGNILKKGSRGFSEENWKVFHPKGFHMFTCGERRARWYLNNDLAKLNGENKIILTFKPNGIGCANEVSNFGLSSRKLRCVVSGEKENLQRHHIVPYCYRKHFPVEFKSKNHHDIVLVTEKVHAQYERYADELKNQLAEEYNIKNIVELNGEFSSLMRDVLSDKSIVVKALKSIFLSYPNINQNKIKRIYNIVSEKTNIEYDFLMKLNFIQLYKLTDYLINSYKSKLNEIKKTQYKNYDHGYFLVNKFQNDNDYENFIKRWRIHFIEKMKPKYMPDGWSINYKTKVRLTNNKK